jgi:peptidoglycan hydrolase-like protein with peptidoglycan-binding domain
VAEELAKKKAAAAVAAPQASAPAKPKSAPAAVAPSAAVVAPAKKPAITAELKVGSKGTAVAYLQKALGLTVTGTFDAATKTAVIAFQKKHKDITKPDGAVGNLTWSKIK